MNAVALPLAWALACGANDVPWAPGAAEEVPDAPPADPEGVWEVMEWASGLARAGERLRERWRE